MTAGPGPMVRSRSPSTWPTSTGPPRSTPRPSACRRSPWFGLLVFVDLGGTRLLLDESAPPALLYLRLDGLDRQIAHLRQAGVEIVAEPHDIFTDDDAVFGGQGRSNRRPSSVT